MNKSQQRDLDRARLIMPTSVRAILNDASIQVQPSGRRAIELSGPNGGGVVAIGLRAIVRYLTVVSGEVSHYVAGGKNRWLQVATAVSAYLHYAEEGPKLECIRSGGLASKKPSKVKKSRKSLAPEAMVRRELQRRIRKMTTSTLLKLLDK